MAIYQFKATQKIHADFQEVWKFISDPRNLALITPPSMDFKVITEKTNHMYEGLMIAYTVKPLLGIKVNWLTEITHVKDHYYFVDEQRVGPYKIWHHEHFIYQDGEDVIMEDLITYCPPFGLLGKLANQLVIKKKLNEIFEFRRTAVEHYFSQKAI